MSQCTHTQMGVLWHAKLGTSLQIACSLHSCSGLHDGHLKLEKDARPDPTKHSAWRERAQERGGWSPGQGGTDDRAKHTKALPQGQHYHIIQAIPRHGTASKQQDGQRQTTTKRPQDSMTPKTAPPPHGITARETGTGAHLTSQ
jgi:hypothetical protein